MLKLISQPNTICITLAMANMLTPLISTVMKPNETAERARAGFTETQFQISRHRVRLRNVVEGHHHQREEQHCGDGADPIPVRGQNAVLIGRSGPAHQFQRAQVCRQEAQSRDPGGHFASGHEEVFAGVGLALQVKADGQYQREVENDNDHVYRREMDQTLGTRKDQRLDSLGFDLSVVGVAAVLAQKVFVVQFLRQRTGIAR